MTFPDNPSPYPTFPPSTGAPDNQRKKTLILGSIVAVLALIVTSIIVLSVKSEDGNPLTPALRLFGVGETQPDPFTPSVALTNRELPTDVQLASTRGAQDRGVRVVNGTEQGLYGAGGTASCDVAALGNSLANDPSAARAWASVFGINPSDIPYYLNTLTPVVLTADTWVTNHSYRSGSAYAFQSVLQAGTPVLVDGSGVPRAICSCGNPLAPPAAAPVGGYRVVGAPWRSYHTHNVVRVAYHTENVTVVNNTTVVAPAADPTATLAAAALSLINVDNAQLFTRTVGNVLNLTGVPPQTGPLPTPADLNVPFTATSDEEAEQNGLAEAGSPQPAEAVVERAAEDGNSPEMELSAGQSAPAIAGGESAPAGGESAAAQSASAAASSPDSSERPRPTTFTGTGEQIGSLSFDDDGTSVSCTVPAEPTTATRLTLDCSDSVAREVYASSLLSTSVDSATNAEGVWSVSLTPPNASAVDVDVATAVWRALPEVTTPTTTDPTTQAPAPAPEITQEPTVETTTPEIVTPTEEPTVETTTPEITTTTTTTPVA